MTCNIFPKSKRTTIALTLVLMVTSGIASAQTLLDEIFGYPSGGREEIEFSRKYKPGLIVVSFSDRKLYFVNRRGSALSYPIAVPSDGKEWAGKLKVTRKRENPSWTPDCRNAQGKPEVT